MRNYKLIALDLDGSLLSDKKEISPENLYWIQKAEAEGLIVAFATGRSRLYSECYWQVVSPTSPMVMANGVEVWENHQKLSSTHLLETEHAQRFITLAKDYGAQYWTSGSYLEEDLLKVGLYHDDLEVVSKLWQIVTDLDLVEVSSSAPNNIEINRKGVSKASGLAEIVAPLGIKPSEVVAIGDGLNDLAMIKWAGYGVSMGNAVEQVKEAADYITTSNEKNGVAKVIEYLLT